MKKLSVLLRAWLPFAAVATALSALVFALVCQDYRQGRDDPQVQMSRDAAEALAAGVPSSAIIIRPNSVEVAKSLAPFLVIYNDAGETRLSGASLDGATPLPPQPGAFDRARELGEERFSWRPRDGVRIAAVVNRFGGDSPGFVLAGRSMGEVDYQTRRLAVNLALSWAGTLAATLVAIAYAKRRELASDAA